MQDELDHNALALCCKCGSNEVAFGARWNPCAGAPAQYGNFCHPCAMQFQSLAPKTGWDGQFSGTHAHHTLSVYNPFSRTELEALHGSDSDRAD